MTLREIREEIDKTQKAISEKREVIARLQRRLHDLEIWEHRHEEASAGIL